MYWDQMRWWVQCLECKADLAAGSLQMHHNIHHGAGQGDQGGAPLPPQGGPPQPGLIPEDDVFDLVSGEGVSGLVNELGQPPDTFCALPHAGHTCDPVGG